MIIVLCGRKGSGKNLAATFIVKHSKLNFIERSFAYDLKKVASIFTGLDCHSNEFKSNIVQGWDMTGRVFLTKMGKILRKYFHKDIFILSLMRKYEKDLLEMKHYLHKNKSKKQASSMVNWIITDWRFENEIDFLKNNIEKVVTIRIVRPCIEPKKNLVNYFKSLFNIGEDFDVTETSLRRYKTDYTIIANNSKELESGIINVLEKLNIKKS